ncbi:phosphoribosylglycinamide formyltransferase [Vibrio algivorus]|uniref:Phosphoribosylglycinamide formyltransferase n=1 Tax=Vibrio algivorus TaxID=1667024 RepID=A0ABQ6ENZ9_9VIBR|nr:phosphoribosylglycinamide formyltransferase [Vibrio algivorus]GLT14858.1 phosphoribosylglycinamide formyltransferase [Vibrio algivorus]
MKFLLRTSTLMLLLLTRTPAVALAAQLTQSSSQTRPQINEACPQAFKHSLSGLYSIPDIAPQHFQQFSNDFEVLYQRAPIAQNELEVLCKSIALNTQTTPLFSGVKSKERASIKIDKELNGEANKITDLARATIVSQNIPSLVTAFEQLQQQATIIEVKNRFKNPNPSGYRDLKVLVQLPKSQLITEVQFHLEEIAKIKNGEEHILYEQIQHIERTAMLENRNLNEIEKGKVDQLRNQSLSLYHDVWQYYLTPPALDQAA